MGEGLNIDFMEYWNGRIKGTDRCWIISISV